MVFDDPGHDTEQLHHSVELVGIDTADREGALRVSLHHFNSPDHVETVPRAVESPMAGNGTS